MPFSRLFKMPMLVVELLLLCYGLRTSAQTINIIPRPVSAVAGKGFFKINHATVIVAPADTGATLKLLKKTLKVLTGYEPLVKPSALKNFIEVSTDTTLVPQAEGYRMDITRGNINISAHDNAGAFYALQSMLQLSHKAGRSGTAIRICTITDHPRFPYRGMHLDVSRHLFTVATLKKWLNVLAFYKINTFQWHLTDDQGWRIQINKYPRLQTVAAYRRETLIGHKREMPHRFDNQPYGGFYTQAQVRDIVRYAAERHITIVPEIEMPGHALAALAAYPQLGCMGGPYQTATFWGVFNDVYCAGNDSTFTFLENVLDEVTALFPGKYIHIGGDECPKIRWQNCPKCQRRMQLENLKNEEELQSYFIRRIEKYLEAKNKRIIGWDEILTGGISAEATVMSWTGTEGGIAAAKSRHKAIMTPEKYLYLDYYQSLYPNEPVAAGGYTPLNKVYNYEPVPATLTADESSYISGLQANVWSEYLTSVNKAEYMIFPRVIALAEVAWTERANRNYPNFLKRLRSQFPWLKKKGIQAGANFDEIRDTVTLPQHGNPVVHLTATLPGSVIRYTFNGSDPTANSSVYKDAINMTAGGKVKAALFVCGKLQGRVWQKSFIVNKAVNKQVIVSASPAARFNLGNVNVLVNGLEGSRLYNDNQWLGFTDTAVVVTVDLGQVQKINVLGINILNYHWQKMWEPLSITFLISADGNQYRAVSSKTNFPDNGVNRVRVNKLEEQARYIRLVFKNRRSIPQDSYGEGGTPLLLIDELIVN